MRKRSKISEEIQRSDKVGCQKQKGIFTWMIVKKPLRRFDPEQIEPQEIDYGGTGEKTQRFDYTVTDPNTDPKIDEVETFRASITASGDIDALLAEGYSLLKLRRKGTGFDTKYQITPVKET